MGIALEILMIKIVAGPIHVSIGRPPGPLGSTLQPI